MFTGASLGTKRYQQDPKAVCEDFSQIISYNLWSTLQVYRSKSILLSIKSVSQMYLISDQKTVQHVEYLLFCVIISLKGVIGCKIHFTSFF